MKTKHKDDCKRAFSNYDATCDRCKELIAGAEPRKGWFEPRPVTTFKSCAHGASNLNPGGYCMICGSGRDFS